MKEQLGKNDEKEVNINEIDVVYTQVFGPNVTPKQEKCKCATCACSERLKNSFETDEEITGK